MTMYATPGILDAMERAPEGMLPTQQIESAHREAEKQRTLEKLGEKLVTRLARDEKPSDEVVAAAERMRRKLTPAMHHDITVVTIVAAAFAHYEGMYGHAPSRKLVAAYNEWMREQGAEVGELTEKQHAMRVEEAVGLIVEDVEDDVYTAMRERIPDTVSDAQVESVVASAYEQKYGAGDNDSLAA